MGTPGFAAEHSLYKSRVHYYTAAALAQAAGAIPQEFSLPVLPEAPLQGVPMPLAGFSTCDWYCYRDDTGACVRNCTICTRAEDGCSDTTKPCPDSECCPIGQEQCNAQHKTKFCCPPGEICCDSQTNFCCPQQCCFDAGHYCCGSSEYCCAGTCCPPASACCNDNCTPLGTDQNCSGCGDKCIGGKTCSGRQCVCPRGFTDCHGVCKDVGRDVQNCGNCDIACAAPANSSAGGGG